MGILWEGNFWVFVLVTVVLGGAAAYQTGKAVSLTWRPLLQLVAYILLLGCAVRFIHFSLFGGTLRSPHYYAADLVVLAIFAAFGFRLTRTRQMVGQYSWLYQRSGPVLLAEPGRLTLSALSDLILDPASRGAPS